MEALKMENYGVQELSLTEMEENNGGLFPLVIAGVTISAKAAGWTAAGAGAAGIFGAGAYVGYKEAGK
ncbi:class IIb bacteriocin, lactobin A/cerein 7B family [Olivibacter sp. SDN3]|uniref:class IIb bacteriocin, lactobin A/cerein 7B family n=1 Tax=Olivibacter sp. SDN3 TaxID=2764720 RepID=UPI00165170C3|nr:class IIb bacteriocin, lactobin A/cerein 7B family [Olivibacter sp. SDN3]QNL51728.1 class IIb bacteriocin, lactobin A/cerein 7B family [Olivibacter sp. SDN3]